MSLDYDIIGERIKEKRIEKQLTQEALATELKISVAFLSRIERGRTQINLKRLTQVAQILGVSTGYLLSGCEEETTTYLDKEFKELLEKCSPEKQKFIYEVARLVAKGEFAK